MDRRSLDRENLSTTGVERATTGSLLRELNKGRERGFGCGIERLDLADNVGFRLVLSVKTMDYCGSKGRACEHC